MKIGNCTPAVEPFSNSRDRDIKLRCPDGFVLGFGFRVQGSGCRTPNLATDGIENLNPNPENELEPRMRGPGFVALYNLLGSAVDSGRCVGNWSQLPGA